MTRSLRQGTALLLIVLGLSAAGERSAGAALPEAPRKAVQAVPTPPASAVHLTRVQLGAWRTAIEAAKGWDLIQKRAGGAFDGLSPRVVPAKLPGRGVFYRLWVGPLLKASASRFCVRLQTRHIDCIPAPNDAPVPPSGVYQANQAP